MLDNGDSHVLAVVNIDDTVRALIFRARAGRVAWRCQLATKCRQPHEPRDQQQEAAD